MVNIGAFAVSVPSWAVDAGLKFINNPDDVFYNFHLDNVDYSPVLESEPATIRTNFLTTCFRSQYKPSNRICSRRPGFTVT